MESNKKTYYAFYSNTAYERSGRYHRMSGSMDNKDIVNIIFIGWLMEWSPC